MTILAAPVEPPVAVDAPPITLVKTTRPRQRPSGTVLLAGLALLGFAAVFSAVESDGGTDLLGSVRSVYHGLAGLSWPYALAVIALAAVHYLATAVALRAAAGVRMPLRETARVQLAAAAANRLTPAGLGGSALNVRYLARRGLTAPRAVGAVAALGVLGALADLVMLAALVGIGVGLGASSSRHQFTALGAHIVHMTGPLRTPWLWAPVGGLVLGVALVWFARRRPARLRTWLSGLFAPLRRLIHRPGELAMLLVASAGTTLVLALAFAATTAMLPGPRPAAGLLVLVLAYLLGAAAGNAVPLPAGLGSTEAALVALLVGMHMPVTHALAVVLVFRLITFWAPAALGLLVTRRLVRDGAL